MLIRKSDIDYIVSEYKKVLEDDISYAKRGTRVLTEILGDKYLDQVYFGDIKTYISNIYISPYLARISIGNDLLGKLETIKRKYHEYLQDDEIVDTSSVSDIEVEIDKTSRKITDLETSISTLKTNDMTEESYNDIKKTIEYYKSKVRELNKKIDKIKKLTSVDEEAKNTLIDINDKINAYKNVVDNITPCATASADKDFILNHKYAQTKLDDIADKRNLELMEHSIMQDFKNAMGNEDGAYSELNELLDK